jgi:hypothetical protein
MALFFDGASECTLCGRVMRQRTEAIICFPAFISNHRDPLWQIHDGCFHRDCFERHPLAPMMLQRLSEWERGREEWPPHCPGCRNRILDADEVFSFPHLVESPRDPLHAYNFKHYHRNCLVALPDLDNLERLLLQLQDSGAWGGDGLQRLIRDLQRLRRRGA